MLRFLPALILGLLGIVTAPFLGLVRNALLDTFPRSFVVILAGALGGAFLVLLGVGVWRIRSHRWPRYGALAAVGGLVAVQTFLLSRGIAEVDVVEKIHLVQYGSLAFLLYQAQRRAGDPSILVVPLLGALVGGTLEEWVQWWSQVRVGEIKDVMLNAYAGVCGLLAGLALLPPERFSWTIPPGRRRALGVAAAGSMILTGAFYQQAHLGHVVRDPAIGAFHSAFTAEELLSLSRQRAESWARKAPDFQSPFQGEDRYASEAGWHVGHRNVNRESGRAVVAWRENQILEKYYSPFLDLSLPGTPQGHRLSPAQVEEIKARLPKGFPHDPGSSSESTLKDAGESAYESIVLEGRIDAETTPARLWLMVGSLALAFLAWGLTGSRRASRGSGAEAASAS